MPLFLFYRPFKLVNVKQNILPKNDTYNRGICASSVEGAEMFITMHFCNIFQMFCNTIQYSFIAVADRPLRK